MSDIESLLKWILANFPSTWNVLISTIVFVVVVWYLQKWLSRSDKPKSAPRGLGVVMLAFVLSSASGVLVDWALVKFDGPQPKPHMQLILEQMIENAGIILE